MKYQDPINFNFSKNEAPHWDDDSLSKIDIGCGIRPIPNCDAYVDLYPDNPIERAGGKTPQWCRDRLTTCNIIDMPFKDKEFDFSYARSVLEHIEGKDNLKKACEEIQRISKAGYITGPSVHREKKNLWKYHKWFVWTDGEELYFLKKGLDYETFEKDWKNKEVGTMTFEWKDCFKFNIYNE